MPADLSVPGVTDNTRTGLTTNSLQSLGERYDLFLQLLTTQLRHQDPLDPVDSSEFTNQLVQFASVEQQVQQNQSLKDLLVAQELSTATEAVDFIGRLVETPSPASLFFGGSSEWTYTLPGRATVVELEVLDDVGHIVATFNGSNETGSHTVNWNGTATDLEFNGQENARYELRVTAYGDRGQRLYRDEIDITGFDIVRAIEVIDGKPNVVTGSNRVFDLRRVTYVSGVAAPPSVADTETSSSPDETP